MAGAGPTDLHYGSRGLPAAYRHPGTLGPHAACPRGPGVTINDTIREAVVEGREERRQSGRRVGTVDDMEDIFSFLWGSMSKTVSSPSTRGRIGRGGHKLQQWLKGPALLQTRFGKTVQERWKSAKEMTPSPARRMFSAPSDSEGYHTCYPLDGAGAELDFRAGRSHTALNPELDHDAEREALRRRSAATSLPRHARFGMMGADAGSLDGDGTDDTVMGGGEERGALGGPPRDGRDREGDGRHPREDAREVACRDGTREDHCDCRRVDFLIGSYPRVGKDAII